MERLRARSRKDRMEQVSKSVSFELDDYFGFVRGPQDRSRKREREREREKEGEREREKGGMRADPLFSLLHHSTRPSLVKSRLFLSPRPRPCFFKCKFRPRRFRTLNSSSSSSSFVRRRRVRVAFLRSIDRERKRERDVDGYSLFLFSREEQADVIIEKPVRPRLVNEP